MILENSLTRKAATAAPTSPAQAVPRLFEGEHLLTVVGVIGPILSAILAVLYLIQGPFIGKEGDLIKPIEFNLALGLFIINTAAVMPLAGFQRAGRTFMRWSATLMALYAYGAETVLTLQGYDPRFSRQFHSFTEALPSVLFGLVSILIIIYYVYLMYRFFRANRTSGRTLLTLAVRYGMLSVMVAFAAGLWMINVKSRHVGGAGNILSLHFIGFEGFKVMLLTGWLAERSALAARLSRRWIHIGGIAWLGSCAAVYAQTRLGQSVLTPSLIILAGLLCVGVWGWATWRCSRREIA